MHAVGMRHAPAGSDPLAEALEGLAYIRGTVQGQALEILPRRRAGLKLARGGRQPSSGRPSAPGSLIKDPQQPVSNRQPAVQAVGELGEVAPRVGVSFVK